MIGKKQNIELLKSEISKRFKSSLTQTYHGTSSQQIKRAEQYIDMISNDPDFSEILPETLVELSKQSDINLQKAIMSLLQRMIIEFYCKQSDYSGSYAKNQFVLCILFSCINNLNINFSIKIKISRVIKSIVQFQDSSFKVKMIQTVQKKLQKIEIFIQEINKGNKQYIKQIELILLYANIISENIGYSSAAFTYFGKFLVTYTHILNCLLQLVLKENQKGMKISYQTLQMISINIEIISNKLSQNYIIDEQSIIAWLYSSQTTKAVKFIIQYLDINSQRYYIEKSKKYNKEIHNNKIITQFQVNSLTLLKNILFFTLKIQSLNKISQIEKTLQELIKLKLLPLILGNSKQIVKKNQTNLKVQIAILFKNLQIMKTGLNFYCFYSFYMENIATVLEQIFIPLIKSRQTHKSQTAEDFLHFSQFLSGKQRQNKGQLNNDQQSIYQEIKKKISSIIPFELLSIEDKQNKQSKKRKIQQVNNTIHKSQNVCIFDCQKISIQIIKEVIVKIDGFSSFFFEALMGQMTNFNLIERNKQETWLILLIIAKDNLAQYPQMGQKTMKLIDQQFTVIQSSLNNVQSENKLSFKYLILILSVFRSYMAEIHNYWQDKNDNFEKYLRILIQMLEECSKIKFMNDNQLSEQHTTIRLLILYILKDIASQLFGDCYTSIVFTTMVQMQKQVQKCINLKQSSENNQYLVFLHSFFNILDQIIELFSFQLQSNTDLKYLVQNCSSQMIKIYVNTYQKEESHILKVMPIEESHLLKVMSSLIWRTLMNIQSRKNLLQNLIPEYTQILQNILFLLKSNKQLYQSMIYSENHIGQYLLIVANSLMKVHEKISYQSIQITRLYIKPIEQQNYDHSFSYFFQFVQSLIYYHEENQQKQSIIQKESIFNDTNNGAHQNTHKNIQKNIQKYTHYEKQQTQELINEQEIILLQKQFQANYKPIIQNKFGKAQFQIVLSICMQILNAHYHSALKKCQSVIILQNMVLHMPQYFSHSMIQNVFQTIQKIFDRFEQFKEDKSKKKESEYPLIQNIYSLMLAFLGVLGVEQQWDKMELLRRVYKARDEIKFNIMALIRMFQNITSKAVINSSQELFDLESIFDSNNNGLTIKKKIMRKRVIKQQRMNSSYQQYIYLIFDMLIQGFQEYTTNQNEEQTFNEESMEQISTFLMVQKQIVNKYSQLNELEQLKKSLSGEFIQLNNSNFNNLLQSDLRIQLSHIQPLLTPIILSNIKNTIVTQSQTQFTYLIQGCIAQANQRHKQIIKELIRTEKVNNSNRKIYKIK